MLEPAQLAHVASLAHALSSLQHVASRQLSQRGTPVGVCPAHDEPLELELELEADVVELALELELELELEELVVPPQSSGYVPLGSAPPGGATQS